MDIQQLLAVNIMLLSALAVAAAALQGAWRDQLLWMAVNAVVVAAGLAMLQWSPGHAGTLVALLFLPLVVAPIVLARMAQTRLYRRQMTEAGRFARWAAWVHPTRQTRLRAAMIEAQSTDSVTGQVGALRTLARQTAPQDRPVVEATALRLEGKWEEVRGLVQREPRLALAMPGLGVRALGETGQIDQMTRAYDDAKAHLHGADLLETQLFLLAFAGRPTEAAQLLGGPLAGLDDPTRDYWLAIAERSAGAEASRWRPALERLAANAASQGTRLAAERILALPDREARPVRLDDVSTVIVADCAGRMQRMASPDTVRTRLTPVTWLLLAGIAVGYGLSLMRGGASDLRTLVDLGALVPPLVTQQGEWWRLATALFLHWGTAHAAINSFMLVVLGRPCERVFGSLQMAAIYLLGGLFSTGFVLWTMVSGWAQPATLVGASGAIMALFGALASRSLVAWLRYRDVLDGRNLVSLAVIAAVQVAVDLASPQVSLAAHASGFVAGMVIGTVLTLFTGRRPA